MSGSQRHAALSGGCPLKKPVKDVAASIRQRLLNNAKSTNRPFQEVLQYFAMERFLYRLTQSPHGDRFILKGALMFTVWGAPATRPTKDIDFLARTENTVDAVLPLIRAVCAQPVEPDGLDRKSTRPELQSHSFISYAVFCL